MATRESSLTIAACFRRSSSLRRHSTALSNNSPPCLARPRFLSLSVSLSLSISLSLPLSSFPLPHPVSSLHLLRHFHLFPRPRYSLHKPASFLSSIPVALSSNLHSIPLLSSLHSTPKYCNFSLVATTVLQLRNDKFLARLPCLIPPFLSLRRDPLSCPSRSLAPHRPRFVSATTSCFHRG